MTEPIGYVVVEYNQASHQPERLESDVIHASRGSAEESAAYEAERAACHGRREPYVVAEIVEPEYGDG